MTIRRKLLITTLTMCLAGLAVRWAISKEGLRLCDEMDQARESAIQQIDAIATASEAMARVCNVLEQSNGLQRRSPQLEEAIARDLATTSIALQRCRDLAERTGVSDEDYARLSQLVGGILSLQSAWDDLIHNRGHAEGAVAQINQAHVTLSGVLALRRHAAKGVFAGWADTADGFRYAIHLGNLAGIGVLLAGLLIVLRLAGQIVRRLERIRAEAREIAHGNLTARLQPEPWRDEIADVGTDFNNMVDALRESQQRLQHNAMHDALTGLPNRLLFADRVEQRLQQGVVHGNYNFAVLAVNLDHFALINDSLGHDAGDRLLCDIARRLQDIADDRTHGLIRTIARTGGDEFAVLVDELPSGDAATAAVDALAERLRQAIAAPLLFNHAELVITPSTGVVMAGGDYTDAIAILRDADLALYRAKAAGRSRHVIFHAAMHTDAVDRLRLHNDLRHALPRGELSLHYQPLIDLQSRELLGFESLMRWKREGKMISPAQFIPVAEETGLIVPMGLWAIEEACRQLALWLAVSPRPLKMNVNVSRKQLTGHLASDLHAILTRTRLDPKFLVVEVTESTLIDHEQAKTVLRQLRDVGVAVHIDDFGTGYSSLSCLHDYPVNGMKIDRAFVMAHANTRDQVAVLHAIVQMAHDLGMQVVAEGIETLEQVALLQALEADIGQGYYFAKPMPPEQALAMITNPNELRRSA